MVTKVDEELLEEKLAELEAAQVWSPRLVSKLEALIRTGNDFDLFRINPLRFASEREVDESEAIDLFLYASKAGLFDMDWVLVCASCANVFKSFRKLEKVDPHFVCDLCSMDNEADLDDYIQVAFTISPQIRSISFHDPASLSPEDLYFRYHRSSDVKPFPNGVDLPALFREWTELLSYLEPDETKTVEFELAEGAVGVSDVLNSISTLYLASPDAPAGSLVSIEISDDGMVDSDHPLKPYQLEFPEGTFLYPATGQLRPGPVSVSIHNGTSRRASAWVLHYRSVPEELLLIQFGPVLSAKRLLSTQTFRQLFRSETAPDTETLRIKDLTYLFTDLTDSTAIYDSIGDANAYNLVRLHFDALVKAVAQNAGAVTKTIGDAIMATFPQPSDAVQAALDMLSELAVFNRAMSSELTLKIGMHRGHSIAVTLNDRIDYFGQSVNIASRVQHLASAGEVILSEDVYMQPGVAELVAGFDVERESGIMKGVAEQIPVYRVKPVNS